MSEDPKCVVCAQDEVLASTKIGWLCEEYPFCFDGYVTILEENIKLTSDEILKLMKEK